MKCISVISKFMFYTDIIEAIIHPFVMIGITIVIRIEDGGVLLFDIIFVSGSKIVGALGPTS